MSALIRPAASIHSRRLAGGDIVLLDFSRGEYFALDAVGAVIWEQIETGASIAQIAAILVTRYDVAEDAALRDVTELVARLREHLLVVDG